LIRNKRRHNTGFGYIGSGNSHFVFNRKPRQVFSEFKAKLNTESKRNYHLKYIDKQLTREDRLIIKNKIRKGEKMRTLLVFAISLFLSLAFILILIQMIKSLLF
jgi:hypothetical protein